jgi:hypothetical protein
MSENQTELQGSQSPEAPQEIEFINVTIQYGEKSINVKV